MDELVPKDPGEEGAIFRSQVIGPGVHRQLTRGELRGAMRELARQKFRPPGAERTRHFSVPTLERWYYRFRKHGLAALRPQPRKDAGRAKALDEQQKQLVCDVRREHPSASAELIVATLVRQGRVREGVVSAATVRRLLTERGLDRVSLRGTSEGLERRRWEAAYPGALWHGDVCHGPVLTGGAKSTPLRIHALLDDRSRYVLALEARSTEREDDMLGLLVRAVRQHGVPETLYLDNGSTYSGKTLATACPRLGIALVHARPYDPQARGKRERFWRTLREGCLDHLDRSQSLAEVQRRLDTFLARHYHSQPHASLMGDTPGLVWGSHQTRLVSETQLAEALTVRARRRVSRDGVISLNGRLFEVRHGFLAGRLVNVASCLVEGLPASVRVEHDGRAYELQPLDVQANARAHRARNPVPPTPSIPFDPTAPDLE